ncbi:hypothetical protein HaLaN_21024 [Haematococcus lacustris]|uniref:Uncharacterized protein n=1 Tax=Haematococcus lacustris TaxID=44745 RepID=A0A699ZN82_HAELA|nr:hypothetical protein HaLaN_21024 [Haematococcus lacustris]
MAGGAAAGETEGAEEEAGGFYILPYTAPTISLQVAWLHWEDVAMTVSALEALGQANAPPPRLVRAVGEHVSRILTQERTANQATGRHAGAERDGRDARVVLGWLYNVATAWVAA